MSIQDVDVARERAIEANAEACAAELYDNLRRYQRRERGAFVAHFILNVGETDVQDRAHDKFLEATGIDTPQQLVKAEPGEDSITSSVITAEGTLLHTRLLLQDSGEPYHVIYSSDEL